MLGCVSGFDELLAQPLGISLGLVSLEHYVALGVDQLGQVHSLNVVPPFVEEVLDPVLGHVHQGPLKEALLEVLILTPVLQGVERTLLPSLEKAVEDLPNTPGTVREGFAFSLPYRLRGVMPVLEGTRHVQIHDSLGDLE